jgi:hypothetical protein
MASMYDLWVSVFGMMKRFFDETGTLLRKRSRIDICSSDAMDLRA